MNGKAGGMFLPWRYDGFFVSMQFISICSVSD